jgi:hypothetical protein
LASKTIGQYVSKKIKNNLNNNLEQVGREYLMLALAEPLNELLGQDISLEIDSGFEFFFF